MHQRLQIYLLPCTVTSLVFLISFEYMAMPGQPLLYNLWMIMISRPVLSFAKLPVSNLTEEI
jgi:hypothetical protein